MCFVNFSSRLLLSKYIKKAEKNLIWLRFPLDSCTVNFSFLTPMALWDLMYTQCDITAPTPSNPMISSSFLIYFLLLLLMISSSYLETIKSTLLLKSPMTVSVIIAKSSKNLSMISSARTPEACWCHCSATQYSQYTTSQVTSSPRVTLGSYSVSVTNEIVSLGSLSLGYFVPNDPR